MKRHIAAAIIGWFFMSVSMAQITDTLWTFQFRFVNDNFFYNREYYNLIADSYTLAGQAFDLEVGTEIFPGWTLNGGADVLWYWGQNMYPYIKPVYYLEYRRPDHFFRMGTLDNSRLHKIIRPLMQSDRLYRPDTRLETGMQYVYSTEKVETELWVDWHYFILPQDSLREVIQGGWRLQWHAVNKPQWKLRIPVQFLVHHRGGQINLWGSYNEDLNNLFVVAYGAVGAQLLIPHKQKGEWNVFGYVLGHYVNETNTEDIVFKTGKAVWLGGGWYKNNLKLTLSYWQAWQFNAPTGEDIFQTVSRRVERYVPGETDEKLFSIYAEPVRKLWILEGGYYKNFSPRFTMQLGGNIFYQPYLSFIPGYTVYPVYRQTDYLFYLNFRYKLGVKKSYKVSSLFFSPDAQSK